MKNISIPSPPSLGMSISDGTAHVYDRAEWKKIQTNVTYRVHIAFLRGPEIFIGIRCLARIERVKRYIIFHSLSLSLALALSLCGSVSVSLSPSTDFSFIRTARTRASIETTIRNIDRARRFIVSSLLLLLLFLWKFSPLCPCSMAR